MLRLESNINNRCFILSQAPDRNRALALFALTTSKVSETRTPGRLSSLALLESILHLHSRAPSEECLTAHIGP